MKKLTFLFAIIFIFSGLAEAHPLGNFSINQYSRLEVEKTNIKLRSVLDMAEIPTFQAANEIDSDKNGVFSQDELNVYADKLTPIFAGKLSLAVNNENLAIRTIEKNISLKTGAGNLPTIRVEWDFAADLPVQNTVNKIHFENSNYAERLGWNEVVINRTNGINIYDSNAFGSSLTDELKAYPSESLNAPLAERSADFSLTSGLIPQNAKPLQNRDGHLTATVQKDKFAELIAVPEITLPIILFGLLVAFGFGAMHALSPGHGKTVVGAYLVGSRGTFKHAAFLGLTVTVTHTLGVFALGLITLFASNYILPERLLPFLNFVSGLLVLFIGLTLFKERLLSILGYKKDGHHHTHDAHEHHSDHTHSHADGEVHSHGGTTHSHLPPEKISWKSLLALGVSGGLLPCPSALVLMLSAISLGRIGYGLLLTIAFSFGLSATLTGFGIAFLYVGKLFESKSLSGNIFVKALPVFSAFVIACLGAVICYGSLA